MSSAEKLVAALRGTSEERALLIQDADPLVATTVLASPVLTLSDIETYAAMENVSVSVLLNIAAGWAEHARIVELLLRNPSTPTGTARRLIFGLPLDRLKALSGDLGVPERLRETAQRRLREQSLPSEP